MSRLRLSPPLARRSLAWREGASWRASNNSEQRRRRRGLVGRQALYLIGALAAGCGEPLVDIDYEGQPAFTLTGLAEGPSPSATASRGGPLRMGLLWATDSQRLNDLDSYAVGRSEPMPWPAEYAMHIFERPTDGRLLEGRYAIARLIAYGDDNGNERFDPDDDTLYSAAGYAAVYAPVGLPANVGPTALPLEAGYTLVKAPFRCGETGPDGTQTCDVNLGALCINDTQCADGTCIKDDQGPTGQGSCGTEHTANTTCEPKGARQVARFTQSAADSGRIVWVQACQTNADCVREDYQCDAGQGACGAPIDTRLVTNEPVPGLNRLCR